MERGVTLASQLSSGRSSSCGCCSRCSCNNSSCGCSRSCSGVPSFWDFTRSSGRGWRRTLVRRVGVTSWGVVRREVGWTSSPSIGTRVRQLIDHSWSLLHRVRILSHPSSYSHGTQHPLISFHHRRRRRSRIVHHHVGRCSHVVRGDRRNAIHTTNYGCHDTKLLLLMLLLMMLRLLLLLLARVKGWSQVLGRNAFTSYPSSFCRFHAHILDGVRLSSVAAQPRRNLIPKEKRGEEGNKELNLAGFIAIVTLTVTNLTTQIFYT